MTVGLFSRYLLRESRGSRSRLTFFVLCLAIGVAAIVSVTGLSNGLRQGIRTEARKLLAGDLAVTGRRPLPAALDDLLATQTGVQSTGSRARAFKRRSFFTLVTTYRMHP